MNRRLELKLSPWPFVYSVSYLLSAVMTGFNYPTLIKHELNGYAKGGAMAYFKEEAGRAVELIIAPEVQFIPFLIIGTLLFCLGCIMPVINREYVQHSQKLPPFWRKVNYMILLLVLIYAIFPMYFY